METRHTDPIIAELRSIRQAYAARFDYDVEAMFRDIRARLLPRTRLITC